MSNRHLTRPAALWAGVAAGLLVTLAAPPRAHAAPPWTEIVVKASKSSGIGKRTIRVATPPEYARGRDRYSVLVMLDAEDQPAFELAIAQVRYLAANTDSVPPMIVVGIVNGPDRLHDMTPPPTGSSVESFKTAGGAAAFADFVLGDVLPAVRARYRTLATTVLAGHSAGGLFALDTAASRPGSFHGVVAMDPAIWFNDGAPARLYADAIARSPAGTRVFAGHGGIDADIDAATTEFSRRLAAAKSPTVAFASRRYPDDSHAMVPVPALPDGLRFVFAPVAYDQLPIAKLADGADAAAVTAALDRSEALYADGARSLQLPEALPERAMNRAARFALYKVKDVELGIRLLERNVALHPSSARAVARLGGGYLEKGDTAAAIAQLKRAIAMAPSSPTELPDETAAELRELMRKKPPRK